MSFSPYFEIYWHFPPTSILFFSLRQPQTHRRVGSMLQRTICFLNHLRISCRPAVQPLPNALVWPIHNSILLHCHNTVIKIRKLKLIHYYHLSLTFCSGFDSCPSNMLYSKKMQSFCCKESCIVFSCHVSVMWIFLHSKRALWFFLDFYSLKCLKITGQLFYTMSLRFHVFPHNQFQVMYLLPKKSKKWLFFLHPNRLQYVPFLKMLTSNKLFLNICI